MPLTDLWLLLLSRLSEVIVHREISQALQSVCTVCTPPYDRDEKNDEPPLAQDIVYSSSQPELKAYQHRKPQQDVVG